MRKALAGLVLVVGCQHAGAGSGDVSKANAPGPDSHPMAALTQRYLDGLFKAKPHLATFMGDHRFDDVLPDLTPEAVARRDAELVALGRDVADTGPRAASLDERIDLDILHDAIALELLYLREIREWEWSPGLTDSFPVYDPREMIAERLSTIVHGDFAPEAARRASVTAELRALPRFLTQARASLAHPGKRRTPKVQCEIAIKRNAGRIEFFEADLKEFTKGDAAAEAARVAAVGALKEYQAFLEKELLPVADGDWRLGEALYAKKFPLALQTDRTPAVVAAAADASFRTTRAELVGVARRLAGALWPKEPTAGLSDAEVIRRVKDELSKNHPAASDLVAAHASHLDQMRAFIEKHDLLSLPPKETLSVSATPLFKRGGSSAEYLAPGALDRRPEWRGTYYVDPVDPTWPPERVESFMRGQNDYEVDLTAMHEAYPGHHVQFFYSKKNLDPIRAVLWNAPMAEGWAVYGEGQMVQNGYGDAQNDRYRFFDLRGQMVVSANTILDIALQSGKMTDDEAVRFMVEDGFQERAVAEKKLLRAKLDSTQLVQYFLGLDEIRALERDYKKRVGASFRQRTFNEMLIDHGTIAIKFLRRYVEQGAGG